ncbi:hypothetical protein SDJN02_25160, partial [Cucurbita argyrosperma subsp. argyrosperma]
MAVVTSSSPIAERRKERNLLAPEQAMTPRSRPSKYIPFEKFSGRPLASVTTPPASCMITTPAA